jgi:hypothetical protein
MTDPRFTLPESPELLARARAVARQRYIDWRGQYESPARWAEIWPDERDRYTAAVAMELRDLSRPASYDAAIRWLVELLANLAPGESSDGWFLVRVHRGWELRFWGGGLAGPLPVPATVTNPCEALVLAITAALESRR